MGTNFYIGGRHSTHPERHIGKRSAAGMYCWDCKVTLCKEGESRIHYYSTWHICCPKCGKPPQDEKLENSAAGLELGFNKKVIQKKTGVSSCSSFSWAQAPEKFKKKKIKWVWNEYGTKYSKRHFERMLKGIPIHYTHLIGEEFS